MKGNRGEEERFRPRFRFVARLASWLPRTESGEKAASGASQAARAGSRILPHRPCRVVMELNSGKGTGTR